jgi:hypothetical protein
MSLFDRFKGKKKLFFEPKMTIQEISFDTGSGEMSTREYASPEEFYAHLEQLLKDAIASSPPADKQPCDFFSATVAKTKIQF